MTSMLTGHAIKTCTYKPNPALRICTDTLIYRPTCQPESMQTEVKGISLFLQNSPYIT